MKLLSKYMFFLTIIVSLTGCGGGSSQSGINTGSAATTPSTDTSLNPSTNIAIAKSFLQVGESTSVSATFVKNNGAPAANIPVTFSTTLGTLNPVNGITSTDSNGVATVQFTAGSASGQGVMTVFATVDSLQYSPFAFFSINMPSLKLSTPTVETSTISYGDSTKVTVSVLDANGNLYTAQPVDVVFTSLQAATGKATISSPVRTVNGVATASYTASTFSGSDTITASIANDSKTVDVNVLPLNASAISFVSATPTTIVLKGMASSGNQETSKVTFKVVDTAGLPKANQAVDFALTTAAGGLSLLPTSGSSDANGLVSTTVQAGTVATPFRVTATLRGTSIVSQSSQLVVSTGVPANISLSFSKLASESWSYDGINVSVTARISDSSQNPVQDGTAVYFTTDDGSIAPSCFTASGSCSVNWTSQAPRSKAGKVTITAAAVGAGGSTVSKSSMIISSSSMPNLATMDFDVKGLPVAPLADPVVPISTQSTLTIVDANNNTMPSGTTVVVTTNDASGLTVSPASITIPDTTTTGAGITFLGFAFSNSSTSHGSAAVTVTVTTPKGVISTKIFTFVW